MAKFYGPIGFAFPQETEEGSGIWEDVIVERNYRGDVIKNVKRWENGERLHDDLNVNNTISIVADPYAFGKLFAIKYIKWLGSYWEITSVETQTPRLVLSIGGVYNGPTAGSSEDLIEHPRFK